MDPRIPVRQEYVMAEVERELDALRAALNEALAQNERFNIRYRDAEAEIERLRDENVRLDSLIDAGVLAEVERLRAALEKIAGASDWHPDDIQAFARATLGSVEDC